MKISGRYLPENRFKFSQSEKKADVLVEVNGKEHK
jgi:hypothetical protein